jgi:hypothetical protein
MSALPTKADIRVTQAAKGEADNMARRARDGSGLEIKVEINCVDTQRDDPAPQ